MEVKDVPRSTLRISLCPASANGRTAGQQSGQQHSPAQTFLACKIFLDGLVRRDELPLRAHTHAQLTLGTEPRAEPPLWTQSRVTVLGGEARRNGKKHETGEPRRRRRRSSCSTSISTHCYHERFTLSLAWLPSRGSQRHCQRPQPTDTQDHSPKPRSLPVLSPSQPAFPPSLTSPHPGHAPRTHLHPGRSMRQPDRLPVLGVPM